jgi:glutamate racemase
MLAKGIDTLVLGCTHYPLLYKALEKYVGPSVQLVDSARNCALEVQALLSSRGLSCPDSQVGGLQVALTDPSTAFLRVAEQALGLVVGEVRLRSVG